MPVLSSPVATERLLRAMAEELKLPLLQIARQAELAQTVPDESLLEGIETSATQALWFVDSYLLSQRLAQQTSLDLEPVAVSAALHDAAHQLAGLAKQYDYELELRLSGRYEPVMAHARGLRTALVGLGNTLIGAADAAAGAAAPRRLVLAAHRSRGGVVAGVFSQTEGLSQAVYRQGKALYGRTRQPLTGFSVQGGAGVFMADILFASMQSRLRVARHHNLTGLAATLPPSRQLVLV